jgi:hypothetical protein
LRLLRPCALLLPSRITLFVQRMIIPLSRLFKLV